MDRIKIRNMTLGQGIPKICASLVQTDYPSLIKEAGLFSSLPVDLGEWRCDWYGGILEHDAVTKALPGLRKALGDIPLLFTFRTQGEGGNRPASLKEYRDLLCRAICSDCVDLVDVELFLGHETVRDLAKLAHDRGVRVILSNHDFHSTPDREELLDRLKQMEALGADLAKIAVMPESPEDVLTLLSATSEAAHTLSCPVISMSMKGTGLVSRLSGELFGSCLTFGSVGDASAPGQIDVRELRGILDILHREMENRPGI